MKKGIAIFDLTDTLINTTAVWRDAYALLAKELGFDINDNESQILETKGITEAIDALMDYHRVPYTHSELTIKLARYALSVFDKDAMLMPQASAAVAKMKDEGYAVVAISNTNPAFLEKAKTKFSSSLALDKWYGTRELALAKDDKKLYDIISDDLGLNRSSCILIDNSKPVINAASRIGIQTIYVDDGKVLDAIEAKLSSPHNNSKTMSYKPTKSFIFVENLLF